MKWKRHGTRTGAFLIGAFMWSTAQANGPEVSIIDGGASLVPIRSTVVQLLHAYVDVVLPTEGEESGLGHVECDYLLRNPGDHAVDIAMAFVTGESGSKFRDVVGSHRDSEFKVEAAGKLVPVMMRSIVADDWVKIVDSPPDSLPVWELHVPSQDNIRLKITYSVGWSAAQIGSSGEWQSYFKYNARPAALWAGSIEDVRISFALKGLGPGLFRCLLEQNPCTSATILPPGFEWTYPGAVWRFSNWEPDCDFVFTMDTHSLD